MDLLTDPTAQMTALSGITLAFTQVFKTASFIPERFIPLISLIIGSAVGFSFGLGTQSIFVGLIASGFWSGTRTVINK